MIIKHKSIKSETTTNRAGKQITKTTESMDDLSTLTMGKITWEGSRLQVARRLEFQYAQDARDPNLANYVINCGETIYGYDEDGTLQFQGNVYAVEKDVQASSVKVLAYDNLFILTRSKTTRKFSDVKAEDITRSVCQEMGIKVGSLAETGIKVSFIAQDKTGYQIIMMAYTEAAAKLNARKKKEDPDAVFHPIMNGDKLDVVKKGTLIEGFEANQYANIMNSRYKESIEKVINKIMLTDQQGNVVGYESQDDSIKKYSMVQAVYKQNPNQSVREQVEKIFHGPDRTGVLEMLGDYRAKASYSIKINDILPEMTGKFWIKSDSHSFENGTHTMKLEIEFENLMNKEASPESGREG
nr:MAG TPA: 43 kDa tail protein [Caudoviricetes sp.]